MDLHITIEALLKRIARLPCADKIVVFGSVAKNGDKPNDLDLIMIDDTPIWAGTSKDSADTMSALLVLARKNQGWLDPFVQTPLGLFVRNDEATDWVRAKNVRGIKAAIAQDGVPLLELCYRLELVQRPAAEVESVDVSDVEAAAPSM